MRETKKLDYLRATRLCFNIKGDVDCASEAHGSRSKIYIFSRFPQAVHGFVSAHAYSQKQRLEFEIVPQPLRVNDNIMRVFAGS